MGLEDDGAYEFGPFRVEVSDRLLLREGTPVPLEPAQFDVLSVLVREAGHLVPRKRLIDAVWKETYVDEGSLTVTISVLRKKLGDSPSQPRFIETIRKSGYRFVAQVTRRPPNTSGVNVADSPVSLPLARDSAASDQLRSHRRLLFTTLGTLSALIAAWYWLPSGVEREHLSAPVPLYPFGGIQDDPSFSPDGAQVAFTWRPAHSDNEDVFVLRVGELEATRLTSHPARDHSPAWSPDGRRIAFIRTEGSHREIILISPAGGPEQKVAQTEGTRVVWNTDSQTLLVVDRAPSEDAYSIFLFSTTGGSKRQITFPTAEHTFGDSLPVISSDGRTLAYVRQLTYDVADIFVQPLDGGKARRLTFDKRQIRGLDWMPDGRELIFSSNRDGRHRLWRVNVSGTRQPTPVPGVTEARSLAVSGSRLVYQAFTEDYNIRVLRRDGGGSVAEPSVFAASIRDEQTPRVSPDGRRLSFVSDRSGWFELWVCTYPEGSNCRQLTSFRQGYVGSPSWAPDSQRLAFDARVDGNADIYLVRADGGPPVRLTEQSSVESRPTWSNDGRWVYYRSDATGTHQIWKMPVAGGAAIQVTKNGGFEALESIDGKSLYYVRERYRRGLWTVPVAGGLEARVDGFGSVTASSWTVAKPGILWIDATMSNPGAIIRFHDSSTGRISSIAEISGYVIPSATGFHADHEGTSLLWSQLDRRAHDLMLLEGFK